jgi:hypothetical protein
MMATLFLTSLHCERKQDMIGKDEARIVVNDEVAWGPGAMEKNETKNLVPTSVPFDDEADVKLQEMNGSKAKQIGATHTITADRPSAQPAVFKTSGAHYELYYRVVN